MEAFDTYEADHDPLSPQEYYVTSNLIDTIDADAGAFMTTEVAGLQNADRLEERLLRFMNIQGENHGGLRITPGAEVVAGGNLTLNSDLDLTSLRYGSNQVPGVLTLRAAGNLNINGNLIDHPTAIGSLTGIRGADSWGMNLVAGADFGSSNFMAVKRGTGNLNIAAGMMVYTEGGDVRFASGNDTNIGRGSSNGLMIHHDIRYNLGSYSGSVRGNVGGNLTITGGAVQTATGDVDITVGGDLNLGTYTDEGDRKALGAIRTTGRASGPISQYWLYDSGGSINLNIAGAVTGGVNKDSWNYDYYIRGTYNWSAQYVGADDKGYFATSGLATMAGGNLTVRTGGDFSSQAGTFGYGKGDLSIYSGGDIMGRFLVRNGEAVLNAMGNFGTSQERVLIEAAPALPSYPPGFATTHSALDVQIKVVAQGNVELATVVNPTIAEGSFIGYWNLGYSQTSSVSLTAVTGNVTISGEIPSVYNSYTADAAVNCILPGTLTVEAGGDILLGSKFALAPSATGTLSLIAGAGI